MNYLEKNNSLKPYLRVNEVTKSYSQYITLTLCVGQCETWTKNKMFMLLEEAFFLSKHDSSVINGLCNFFIFVDIDKIYFETWFQASCISI